MLGCSLHGQSTASDAFNAVIGALGNAKALGSFRLVARDSAALHQVWESARSRQATMPPVPRVDFTRYDVVVIATGAQRITRGAIKLTRIDPITRAAHFM
jgi:hypothetical protein